MEDMAGTIKGFSNVRRLNNRLFSLHLRCKDRDVQWYLISASAANTVAIRVSQCMGWSFIRISLFSQLSDSLVNSLSFILSQN